MILKARIYSSMFGRNVNNTFSNEFQFRSNMPIGDDQYRLLGIQLQDAIATIQINQVQGMRCVISEIRGKNATPVPRGKHMTIYHAVVGNRAPGADPSVGLKEAVLVFGKTPKIGFAGRQMIRGGFYDGELGATGDGTLALNAGVNQQPFRDFAAALPGIFTAHNSIYVLPAVKTEDFETGARPVLSVNFQGVGLLQLTNSRATLSQAEKELLKREIKALERDYQRAARDDNGVIGQIATAVFNGLLQTLQTIILRYGFAQVIKLALPTGVKLLVRALPALL
jgi:predicted RecA/RadA family phage recombinase